MVYAGTGALLGALVLGRAERLVAFVWAGIVIALSNSSAWALRAPLPISIPAPVQLHLDHAAQRRAVGQRRAIGYFVLQPFRHHHQPATDRTQSAHASAAAPVAAQVARHLPPHHRGEQPGRTLPRHRCGRFLTRRRLLPRHRQRRCDPTSFTGKTSPTAPRPTRSWTRTPAHRSSSAT
ncbi:MAG: hypothetical protein R2838_11680 [Caldilineaceae bacterium]